MADLRFFEHSGIGMMESPAGPYIQFSYGFTPGDDYSSEQLEEVVQWCKERFPVGINTAIPRFKMIFQCFYFVHPNDAFEFKMRWV